MSDKDVSKNIVKVAKTTTKKKIWNEPANLIAISAAFLSLVSLVVSIKSCVLSESSYDLSREDFISQRAMVLGSTIDNNNQRFIIKPLDSAIFLQQGVVIFPSDIETQEWQILPPEHYLYTTLLKEGLQKFLEEKVERKPGTAAVALEANVPAIITSQFVAKGQSFQDKALYRIMYSFVINGDSREPPSIEFKGLIYESRIDFNNDSRQFLDRLWREGMERAKNK